jgi:ribosomal protein L4
MKVPVYNIEGKKTSSKELSADVFGIEPNDHAIYLDVKRYLAAQRPGRPILPAAQLPNKPSSNQTAMA